MKDLLLVPSKLLKRIFTGKNGAHLYKLLNSVCDVLPRTGNNEAQLRTGSALLDKKKKIILHEWVYFDKL